MWQEDDDIMLPKLPSFRQISVGGGGGGSVGTSEGESQSYSQYTQDAASQYGYSQQTPVAMILPPEYYRMISEFFNQMLGPQEPLRDKKGKILKDKQGNIIYDTSTGGMPKYMKEADREAERARAASDAVVQFMEQNKNLIPSAYQAASDKYSGTLSDIISGGMSGQSFQETLPEGLIDKLLSGMSVGLGDQTYGSFAPAGAANAVASIYNTRAGERTNVMGLLGELGGQRFNTEVLPSAMQYEYGLKPKEQALQNVMQFPESGFLSAMQSLQNIFSPLLQTAYVMGGQAPLISSRGSSTSTGQGSSQSQSEYEDFNTSGSGGGSAGW